MKDKILDAVTDFMIFVVVIIGTLMLIALFGLICWIIYSNYL